MQLLFNCAADQLQTVAQAAALCARGQHESSDRLVALHCRNGTASVSAQGSSTFYMSRLSADAVGECQVVLDAEKLLTGLKSSAGSVQVTKEHGTVTFTDSAGVFAVVSEERQVLLPTLARDWSSARTLAAADLVAIARLRSWCAEQKYKPALEFVALRFFSDGLRAVAGDGGRFSVVDTRFHPGDLGEAEVTALFHRLQLVPLAAILRTMKADENFEVRWSGNESQVILTWRESCLLLHNQPWTEWPDEQKFLGQTPTWRAVFHPSVWLQQLQALDASTANNQNLNQILTLKMNDSRTALIAHAAMSGNSASRDFPVTQVSLAPGRTPETIRVVLPTLLKVLGECRGWSELHHLGDGRALRVYPTAEKRDRWMFFAQC